MLLGASNTWFPVQSSALAIPSQASELAQRIDEAWAVLAWHPAGRRHPRANAHDQPRPQGSACAGGPARRRSGQRRDRGSPRRARGGEADDLLGPEWRVLSHARRGPRTARLQTASGRGAARAVREPAGGRRARGAAARSQRAARVHAHQRAGRARLKRRHDRQPRTPTAQVAALQRGPRRGDLHPLPRGRPCSSGRPATATRGRAARVARREPRVARERRGMDGDDGWPGERYVLLHSFAHALIRELALECGYTASSIRERLYATSPGEQGTDGGGSALHRRARTAKARSAGSSRSANPTSSGRCCAKRSSAPSCARLTRSAPNTTPAPTPPSTLPPATRASSPPRHPASAATASSTARRSCDARLPRRRLLHAT